MVSLKRLCFRDQALPLLKAIHVLHFSKSKKPDKFLTNQTACISPMCLKTKHMIDCGYLIGEEYNIYLHAKSFAL